MSIQSLFRIRDFRLLFAGATFTNLGDGVLQVALPWAATLLTRDPFLIGVVAMARQAPWIFLALPVGVLTDRLDHKRILLACDGLRVALMIAVASLVAMAPPSAAAALTLAGLACLMGSAEVLRDNTAQTVLPRVVPMDKLEEANGLLWSTEQVAGQFVGPPLAGLLIGVTIALPFGVNAALLAGAVALTASLALPRRTPAADPTPFVPAIREGLAFLWGHPTLRPMALALGAFNFIGWMFWALLVLYAQEVLGLSAVGFGLLLSGAAIGGLSGSLLGPGILRRIGPKAGLVIGISSFAFCALVIALANSVWVIAPILMLEAFTNMLWNITSVSYRQRHIPPEMLGRVNAIYRFFGTGPSALGALTGGAAVSLATASLGSVDALRVPYALCALGGILTTVYVVTRIRFS